VEPRSTIEQRGWNTTTLHLYSHAGTHVDAPVHFAVNDSGVSEIPLRRCMGPAWVADVTDVGPGVKLTVAHLGATAAKVKSGESLLLHSNWSRRIGRPEYYDALPGVGRELAEWCAQRSLAMLGVETPAVADPHDLEEISAIHTILLEAGILIVEGLAHLHRLSQDRVLFLAFPLNIEGGDGSPVRAVAVEETEDSS
jgi:kynurenine formamidase